MMKSLTEILIISTFLTISLAHHRIINGKFAKINQFPYQVSVQQHLQPKNVFEHFCGGTILNKNHVLTAAHCIQTDNLQIRVGILHLNDSLSIGETIKVQRIIIHPNYNDENGTVTSHDLAILRLEQDLLFSDGIQPIRLPLENETFTGKAVLTGWGRRKSLIPSYSNSLMFAEMSLINLDECKSDFLYAIGTFGPLDDNNICTKGDDTYACQGDSGGPLVQNGTILGVVSFAVNPCDLNGSPTAYCEVSKYISWLNKHI
nr:chymotrypsin-2-like [Onthophagus taurus]